MQQLLKALLGNWVRENQIAHFDAIKRAVTGKVFSAERIANRWHCIASPLRKLMGDRISINDACPMVSEQLGYSAFAATYSASQSNAQAHGAARSCR